MQTIRLRINDSVYDKLIWLLSKFSRNEIEIISENADFLANQKYLETELDDIDRNSPVFVDIEDAEQCLDKIIQENEGSF